MIYNVEIDNFLREIIYEPWMSEDDYNEIITDAFIKMNTTKEKLSDDIQTGIDNGYSLDLQFSIIRKALNAG